MSDSASIIEFKSSSGMIYVCVLNFLHKIQTFGINLEKKRYTWKVKEFKEILVVKKIKLYKMLMHIHDLICRCIVHSMRSQKKTAGQRWGGKEEDSSIKSQVCQTEGSSDHIY